MMKFMFLILATILSIVSCKKSMDEGAPSKHKKEFYFVGAVKGTDTVWTPGLGARVETTGLDSAVDSRLKIVLVGFQNVGGKGYYTVDVTNLQPCQMILRWGWDGLRLDSIAPMDTTANTPQSDVLKANQTKRYLLIGDAKVGRIKVQGEHSNNDCPNSSTLIINITTTILPIKWISHTASYDEKTDITTLSFTIDDPNEVDAFVIQKQVLNGRELIYQFTTDHKTKSYKIPIFPNESN